jgi:hypothetical protein
MSRADYAHWNEEATRVWWEEEGRHAEEPRDDYYYDDPLESSAADAFAEELGETTTDDLAEMLADREYLNRWPKAEKLIRYELTTRT